MAPPSGNDDPTSPTEAESNATTPDGQQENINPSVNSDNQDSDDVPPLWADPLWGDITLPLTDSSNTRESGRSSSRSRSRHRHGHRHRRRRSRFRFKRKESNFLAAISSMIVLVLLCTAMAEPRWFFLQGGGCRLQDGTPVNYLGVNQFFYMGSFLQLVSSKPNVPKTEYKYGPLKTEVLFDCVTPQAVPIMKSIITFCLFGVAFSLVAFVLDVAGPTNRLLKILRRNAIFNILTVAVCITINGFSYWAATVLEVFQEITKLKKGDPKPVVQFSISFYLITASGVMSVIAAATNLLRRSYHHSDHHGDRDRLLDDYDGMDFAGVPRHELCSPMTGLPPPPPYAP